MEQRREGGDTSISTATVPRQRGAADQTSLVTLKEITPEDVKQIDADLGPQKESTVLGWAVSLLESASRIE